MLARHRLTPLTVRCNVLLLAFWYFFFHLSFFFFNDTATTEIYTLSLHDALPISKRVWPSGNWSRAPSESHDSYPDRRSDRKSTRLNSSHTVISYAVFCLKKKKKQTKTLTPMEQIVEMQMSYSINKLYHVTVTSMI